MGRQRARAGTRCAASYRLETLRGRSVWRAPARGRLNAKKTTGSWADLEAQRAQHGLAPRRSPQASSADSLRGAPGAPSRPQPPRGLAFGLLTWKIIKNQKINRGSDGRSKSRGPPRAPRAAVSEP